MDQPTAEPATSEPLGNVLVGLCITVILIGLAAGGISHIRSRMQSESADIAGFEQTKQTISQVTDIRTPAPTPFLFQEMTIPFVRTQTFTSSLGALQKVAESATYTSYLTHYTSDGLKIHALLTQPKGEIPAGGWPAIVFVHGYIPPANYQTRGQYAAYVDYLARNGFVVFKIDLRGHGQSEGEAGGGYFAADYVYDTLNAVAALQTTDFVADEKIGLWGHSMAGNVTMRAVAAKPDLPAVVIWAGAVYTYADQREYGIDDNSYRPPAQDSQRVRKRELLRQTHGDFSPDSWFWKQVAPSNYLSDLKGSVQIHHAVDDAVVSIEYSRNLMKLLDATSVPHELFEYKTGGHNIQGASFTQAMQRTAEFFKERFKLTN